MRKESLNTSFLSNLTGRNSGLRDSHKKRFNLLQTHFIVVQCTATVSKFSSLQPASDFLEFVLYSNPHTTLSYQFIQTYMIRKI